MKTRLLIILASVGLLVSVPHVFASEPFHGKSSFENLSSELIPGKPTQFEIKFQYTSEPYALENLISIIDVNPASAKSYVQINVKPIDVTQGQIVRIPVGITVDPQIEHKQIFLSVSFAGDHFSSRTDAAYKSAWSDSVIIDIEKNLVPESEQYEPIYDNCGPGTTLQDGICVVDKTKENSTDVSVRWGGPAYNVESPLKQLKLGVPADKIQCRDSLILVTKNDGSPACVKEQTILKLVERGLIIASKAERDLMLAAGYKLYPGAGWVQGGQEKQLASEPEPERNPIPEGNYVDMNTYAYSVKDAESYLNYTLSTPHILEGTEIEKIKISSDKRKATLYYSNGLEVKHSPMGTNFNNTHYKLNPEREEGKVFYDFAGTFAEGYEIDEPNRAHYSAITIHRDDRIYVRATMDAGLDELLKMMESMDLNVPHVPYTPTPDYVMGSPEPEPMPEPKSEPAFPSDYPRISQNDMYCWTQWWHVQNTAIDEEKLVSSLRSTISMFGPDFEIPNREITLSHNDEETVISIGGSWIKDQAHHEKLTSVIKNHMDGSELIRDNIVVCA